MVDGWKLLSFPVCFKSKELCTGRPSLKDTVFDRFWVPKNGSEDFAVEPSFLCVFATLGKPGGACRAAEKHSKKLAKTPAVRLGALDIARLGSRMLPA